MEECDYCGESFEGEKAYVNHLRAEHMDELGPIDRRRVGADDDGGSSLPAGPVALALVIGATVAVVGYVVFIAGGSGASVGPAGSAHYHGPMQMVVLGEQVDFSRDEYQLRDDRFHFEGGDGSTWHAHATGVTLDYAMESLGFDVTGGDHEQYLILRNPEGTLIGLFEGLFEKNILTFNPGYTQSMEQPDDFLDVREIRDRLLDEGLELSADLDPESTGPASIVLEDPDGNPVLIDQHVPEPGG